MPGRPAVKKSATGGIGRRERRKQEIVERILDVGQALYLEKSFEATTVEQICLRAKISRMTFYKYFPSKQHLIWAQCDKLFFRPIDQLINDALARSNSGITQLRLFLEQAAEHIRSYTVVQRALLRDASAGLTANSSRDSLGWSSLRAKLCELIEADAGNRKDITDRYSSALLAAVIGGALSSMTLRWIGDNKFPVSDYLYKLSDFLSVSLRRG